ncbi:MAG: HD domain-containing protein [Candidatus Paceibacterota bacterium]|jgi:GTP pyrophosphokinase
MTTEEIISLLDSPSEKDKELIKKAYDFSMKAHEGQVRRSGAPYFKHVFETAKILAELKMDPATIAAGLLHDSVEDGVSSEESIKKEFGDEILFLVNGVTKLSKVKYRGAERYVESLRKFFVAVSQDIRVLIIKIADRLNNMRTLEHLDEDKQKKVALETLEIYAPLADRLSIRIIARELEDLSFKYLFPKEYTETLKLLKTKKEETLPHLEKFMRSVKKALAEQKITDFKTDYRQKGIYSFYKKLKNNNDDVEKIYDILAARICLETVSDCYRVLGIIHSTWRPLPGQIKDYIASPKPNGYRSLHTTVFAGDGSIVEVQIRTKEMHYDSEYGIASHIDYKKYGSKTTSNSETKWFAQFLPKIINFSNKPDSNEKEGTPKWIQTLAESQKNIKTDLEKNQFIKDIKADFFNERIFVLTPKGDVIDLPLGSTPIDFAYAVHSNVGDHTSGAKINGKMVSLDTPLKNSDIVEIITKESSKPSTKWLEIVKTSMAKRHINNYLEKLKK